MIAVYYAEDDDVIGKSVKEYLEQHNSRVVIFEMIADIRKALIDHLPAVVLLDWNMPDGQGNELCCWIRERWSDFAAQGVYCRPDYESWVYRIPHCSGVDDQEEK